MAEIYGQTWSETARDLLVALMRELKDTLASGYDPTFSYVYERHNEVMSLPAVSIDIADAVDSIYEARSVTNAIVAYYIPFSVRVHIDYADGVQDGQKTTRLLNSVVNKLEGNRTLQASYYVDEVKAMRALAEFSESDTLGGEVTVIVQILINHSQE